MVSAEAGVLIAKAAELFLESFSEAAYTMARSAGSTTNLTYKDLAAAVASTECLEFLRDIVPEMVKASAALAVHASESNGDLDVH
eukprot:SM000144S00695  [mRNA]  locus=s144:312585:314421:+ [translate_table: standard]